ncbi:MULTISPECIES: carbohydrate kinase [Arthrobacter]|uniref:Carbohydrate kinase n=1 Tax=Arthrobacter terricola TaxID=2547396 RepID=A0A4R5K755_9MICC|nr:MULTISPECIES: carbohydrate kinase [Arthrobacter]MBT8163476.1 carbohydrate kinase [Arthrobacter sp. GN70]TDF89750.1 carbohydrate kinase [Arthrobacter terricola]
MAQETTVTVIGESLVDVISDPRGRTGSRAHPGGSPLNVAVGAARLGLRTSLVTHYSDDPYGLMIEEHLQSNRVDVINGGSAPTSTALATLGPDGGAEYTFSITWDINGACLPALAAGEGSTHVHTGSIATVLPPGDQMTLALVKSARGQATISFDPNCRPAISPDAAAARQAAEVFVAASDIVKASDEDLRWLYPHRTLDETLEAWLALGPAVVALTRGASGPVVLSRNARVDMAAEAIVVADTVGAGDSFMAGLICGLAQLDALGAGRRTRLKNLTRDELRALAAYANRAAAITCSRQGANPPRKDELGPLSVPSPAP